jgi:hypothetical protein
MIVADNPETLDGLEAYLRAAGIATSGTRRIERLSRTVDAATSALILFPDDFVLDQVIAALTDLQTARPKLLSVLVTRESKPFARLFTAEHARAPLILPKPAWGWTILDFLRAQLDPETSAEASR